ncbi:MAG: ATP-binding protein [Desulfatiglandales bacterium]
MTFPYLKSVRNFFEGMGLEEPLSKQKWWVLLRWVLMGVVILTTLIGSSLIHLYVPTPALLSMFLIIFVINAALHYFFFVKVPTRLSDPAVFPGLTLAQFLLDWIFITLVLHYTGGVASPILFYSLIHVILSGALLEKWTFISYVSLIALTVNAMALLELGDVIPHLYSASFISKPIQKNLFFVLMLLFFYNTALYVSSSFVAWFFRQYKGRILKLTDLQGKLERANQQLGLLNQVARDTNLTQGLYPRLDFICQSMVNLLELKGAGIRLLDEKTNRLELVSACGLSEEYLNKGPVDADKSLARALEGEPHFVLDATSDPGVQYPEAARKEGIVSMLAVPLKGRKKVIGTLRLFMAQKKIFTQEELDFIYALAGQGAISIENAQGYEILLRQDKAKSEFIFLMTHELKGPFMAIQSLLEVMLKGYVGTMTEKQKELVDRIYKRIDSVMEVSTGLLDVYQWQTQALQSQWEPLSMKVQAQKAADLFLTSAEEKNLVFVVTLPEEDPIIMATEEEMEKIFNNLITNAIKYTPSGGTVSMTLGTSANRVVLNVKDTGIGIEPQDKDRIFEDFFRTQEAKKIDPYGKGIGLPFVKKIVESLGGDISVDSRKGEGTEFTLSFPKADQSPAQPEKAEA